MERSVDISRVLERLRPSNLEVTPRSESPAELELLTRQEFQEEVKDAFSWTVPLKNILIARAVLYTDTVVLPVNGVDSLCHIESVALLPYARQGRRFLYTGAILRMSPATCADFVAQSCFEDLDPKVMPYAVPQAEPGFQSVTSINVLATAVGGC